MVYIGYPQDVGTDSSQTELILEVIRAGAGGWGRDKGKEI